MSLECVTGVCLWGLSLECLSEVIHGSDAGPPGLDLGFRPRPGSEIEKHRTSVPSEFFESGGGRSLGASHRGPPPGLGGSTGAPQFNPKPEDFDAPPH